LFSVTTMAGGRGLSLVRAQPYALDLAELAGDRPGL